MTQCNIFMPNRSIFINFLLICHNVFFENLTLCIELDTIGLDGWISIVFFFQRDEIRVTS